MGRMSKDDYVRVKVTRETRQLIRRLAAEMDITMMAAVETAVREKLEQERSKESE